jgi:hypothetical protein
MGPGSKNLRTPSTGKFFFKYVFKDFASAVRGWAIGRSGAAPLQ